MKKAQFTSPIIILVIIIISFLIISSQTTIKESLNKKTIILGTIINDYVNATMQDVNYQNELTSKALELLSTVNSTGTIINLLQENGVKKIIYNDNVIIEYSKNYKVLRGTRKINNTISVEYPYTELLIEEQRFSSSEFLQCLGTDCTNIQTCIDNYDTGTFNWEPVLCLTTPLRVKITIESNNYPLLIDYKYNLMNNSIIFLE